MNLAEFPYIQSLLALIGVVFLIVGTAWVIKRYSGIAGFALKDSGELQIQATKQMDPQTKLVVVKWRESEYLLSYNAHAIIVLDKKTGSRDAT